MKKQDQGILGRFSLLSVILLIAGDLAVEPLSLSVGAFILGVFSLIPVVGAFFGAIFGFFGTLATYFIMVLVIGIIVFLNERLTGNKQESIVDALIVMFLVAIPTPIMGVLAGALQFLTMQKIIKL